MKQRLKRGLAIPYAIVILLLVTLMCTLILTSAKLTAKSAVSYSNYLESKTELDEIGSAAIDKYLNGAASGTEEGSETEGSETADYYSQFSEYNYVIKDDKGTVTVSRGSTVMLYIKFTKIEDGVYKLSAYIYEPGTVPEQTTGQTTEQTEQTGGEGNQ